MGHSDGASPLDGPYSGELPKYQVEHYQVVAVSEEADLRQYEHFMREALALDAALSGREAGARPQLDAS